MDKRAIAHISCCLGGFLYPLMAETLDPKPHGDPSRAPPSSQRDGRNGLLSDCLPFHVVTGQCCSNEKDFTGITGVGVITQYVF